MMMSETTPNPDEQLRTRIIQALMLDERTAALDLRVGVLNGIAHLAGTVASLDVRDAAQELAECVCGVRGVVNRIEAPGAPSPARTVNLNLQNEKGNLNE